MTNRKIFGPVSLSLACIFLAVGCTNSGRSNVSNENQDDQLPAVAAPAATSAIAGVSLKYGGESRFFEGSDQYKITFCEDDGCRKTLDTRALELEEKIAQGSSVIKKANELFEKFLYRESSAESIDVNSSELTVDKAIALVKDPEGELGQSQLNENGVAKLQNFLKKNEAKVKVYLADFLLKFEEGDASESYIALYNAETGWVTYILFASYTE